MCSAPSFDRRIVWRQSLADKANSSRKICCGTVLSPRRKACISQEIESSAIVVAPIELHSRKSSLAKWDLIIDRKLYRRRLAQAADACRSCWLTLPCPLKYSIKSYAWVAEQSQMFWAMDPSYDMLMRIGHLRSPKRPYWWCEGAAK